MEVFNANINSIYNLKENLNDSEILALAKEFCSFCEKYGKGDFTNRYSRAMISFMYAFRQLSKLRKSRVQDCFIEFFRIAHSELLNDSNGSDYMYHISRAEDPAVAEEYYVLALRFKAEIEFCALVDRIYHSSLTADELRSTKKVLTLLNGEPSFPILAFAGISGLELRAPWYDVQEAWNSLHPDDEI